MAALIVAATLAFGSADAQASATQPGSPSTAAAVQAEVRYDAPRATRAELTALLESSRRAVATANRKDRDRLNGEIAVIERRLSQGDFLVGDRVTISLGGDTARRELSVREGVLIDLPAAIPPLALAGVLRAELNDVVNAHFRKYLRDPVVVARPLLRIGVSGAVGRPGSYTIPYDAPLAEVVMGAGGVSSASRADEIVVRRGGKEVVKEDQYSALVREGKTVEEAGLRPGDEIFVPSRERRNTFRTVQIVFFSLSALTAILALIRSGYQ